MVEISISSEFKNRWPDVRLACVEGDVEVVEHHPELWAEIKKLSSHLRAVKTIEDISKTPAIQASRKAYKACGKDPARYRLSAEALMRRVIKGNDLYQINNLVDIVNLASVTSGFSIGGYDVNQLNGDVELGVGNTGEPYEGIGRGVLNIKNLPILRDDTGAFGSATSDSKRTSVTPKTNRFLMVYFGFGAYELLDDALKIAEELLVKYANAGNFERYSIDSK